MTNNYDRENLLNVTKMIEKEEISGKQYRMLERSTTSSKVEVEITKASREKCVKSLLK